MCGITGYFDRINSSTSRTAELQSAIRRLHHRGPNDSGMWEGEFGVGLGHTRLAILDLSPAGHQPMFSECGKYAIVFNGEIYNFLDLRKRLINEGARFYSAGDTEVVLVSLIRWGLSAIDQFIGMFAIAFLNIADKKLILIRDRIGVKPLYYGWDKKRLWFASELKALYAYRHWVPEIDLISVQEYFQFGYVNAPRSIFRNIYKLEPGHTLQISASCDPVISRYWSATRAADERVAPSESELEALLEDAFRLRTIADVPLGIFLSGGVDSSLVTALLKKQVSEQLRTYTIGFDSASENEATFARDVAKWNHTIHEEAFASADAAKAVIGDWGWLYDEPFFDSSGIPTYLVSTLASQSVKVVLSADGGDELFSGYNVYSSILRHVRRWQGNPNRVFLVKSVLKSLPLKIVSQCMQILPQKDTSRRSAFRRFLIRAISLRENLASGSIPELYERAIGLWRPGNIVELIGSFVPSREKIDAYPGGLIDQMSLWDIENYLPGDILVKVDRATMARGIESREPLLDHRLVNFALQSPLHFRRGTLGGKHILRKILYRHIPRQLVDRPKKGFSIPLCEWLRSDLRYLLEIYFDSTYLSQQRMLDPAVIHKTVHRFLRGDDSLANKVWSLLAFQLWYQTWAIENECD
jgi:asparagine synthase (glutamine-hydrolysing)